MRPENLKDLTLKSLAIMIDNCTIRLNSIDTSLEALASIRDRIDPAKYTIMVDAYEEARRLIEKERINYADNRVDVLNNRPTNVSPMLLRLSA